MPASLLPEHIGLEQVLECIGHNEAHGSPPSRSGSVLQKSQSVNAITGLAVSCAGGGRI